MAKALAEKKASGSSLANGAYHKKDAIKSKNNNWILDYTQDRLTSIIPSAALGIAYMITRPQVQIEYGARSTAETSDW